jgi:hypothetical protein
MRARGLGIRLDGEPRVLNETTDVGGVEGGMVTIISDTDDQAVCARTGVTAILPIGRESIGSTLPAGLNSLNGVFEQAIFGAREELRIDVVRMADHDVPFHTGDSGRLAGFRSTVLAPGPPEGTYAERHDDRAVGPCQSGRVTRWRWTRPVRLGPP